MLRAGGGYEKRSVTPPDDIDTAAFECGGIILVTTQHEAAIQVLVVGTRALKSDARTDQSRNSWQRRQILDEGRVAACGFVCQISTPSEQGYLA